MVRCDAGEAAEHARTFLRISHACHDLVGIALAIELAAVLADGRDDPSSAAVLLGAASAIWRSVGLPLLGSPFVSGMHDKYMRRTKATLGEREFAALFRHGAGLPEDEAVACALVHEDGTVLRHEPGLAAFGGNPAPVPGSARGATVPRALAGARRAAANPASAWPPLSRRECQVAALVAQGHSNREIADRLMIAKRTVDAHIEHILAKLAFASRT